MAVALLARSEENLSSVKKTIQSQLPSSVIETFSTDTKPENITSAFKSIFTHSSFKDLKLKTAVYSIKHSAKKPFLTETHEAFTTSLDDYVGGAMVFAQESIKLFFAHHGEEPLSASNPNKKGTIIFTGTLGALRTNAEYNSYGAGRASVRMLAQGLGKEFSSKGIHVAHTIANGGIADNDGEEQKMGKKMSAESVGKTYLWLVNQTPDLWTQELDMRPALEKW